MLRTRAPLREGSADLHAQDGLDGGRAWWGAEDGWVWQLTRIDQRLARPLPAPLPPSLTPPRLFPPHLYVCHVLPPARHLRASGPPAAHRHVGRHKWVGQWVCGRAAGRVLPGMVSFRGMGASACWARAGDESVRAIGLLSSPAPRGRMSGSACCGGCQAGRGGNGTPRAGDLPGIQGLVAGGAWQRGRADKARGWSLG